jgi:lipopolysaccharide transport system ATP-binding protein
MLSKNMGNWAIRTEDLGKRYRLGEMTTYNSLREQLTNLAKAPFRRFDGGSGRDQSDKFLWALKDVSFTLEKGEALGIIGRNGAGKSTLLKLLSRITSPTEGWAEMRGRVSALLEVGTGFHPELTGRENIYLNGAILGMKRLEIDAKFDEIVAFAEVERFLDTPIKRYSSGMFVRLAFSVAAHLEPEILVVDEVLAVGDAKFQKKCLGRMGDVSREGRTVLFVSHNMSTIAALCKKGILLEQGRLVEIGPMDQVIQKYLSAGEKQLAESVFPSNPAKPAQVRLMRIENEAGEPGTEFDCHKPVRLRIDVEAHQDVRGTVIVLLSTSQGVRLFHSVCANHFKAYSEFSKTRISTFFATVPGSILSAGQYQFRSWVVPGNIGVFDVADSPSFQLLDISSKESFFGNRKHSGNHLQDFISWEKE